MTIPREFPGIPLVPVRFEDPETHEVYTADIRMTRHQLSTLTTEPHSDEAREDQAMAWSHFINCQIEQGHFPLTARGRSQFVTFGQPLEQTG